MMAKVNAQINTTNVVFINASGKSEGVVLTQKAKQIAKSTGLDLVQVGEKNGIPVCKLMNYGKWKYQQKKKTKKNSKPKTKSMQFSPNTTDHDLTYRAKRAEKFMDNGSSIKLLVKFSGREKEHMFQTGQVILEKFLSMLETGYKIEENAQKQGNTICMVIGR